MLKKITSLLCLVSLLYAMAATCVWAFDADHVWRVEQGFGPPCSFECVCNGAYEMKSLSDFILMR